MRHRRSIEGSLEWPQRTSDLLNTLVQPRPHRLQVVGVRGTVCQVHKFVGIILQIEELVAASSIERFAGGVEGHQALPQRAVDAQLALADGQRDVQLTTEEPDIDVVDVEKLLQLLGGFDGDGALRQLDHRHHGRRCRSADDRR